MKYVVFRKSENTNSFGLYQMYLISKEGFVIVTHAGSLYAKNVGDVVNVEERFDKHGRMTPEISGHEMTSIVDVVTFEMAEGIISEIFNN